MRLIALCVAAVFAGQLHGDLGVEPVTAQSIAGPSTSPRDRLVRLTLEDGQSVKSAVWRSFPVEGSDIEKTSLTSCVMVGRPGTYEIWCVYLSIDGNLGDDVHALTIEGAPDPIPPFPVPPGPNPDPTPTPVPSTTLGRAAYDRALAVPHLQARRMCAPIAAGVFRSVAAQAAALPASFATPQDMVMLTVKKMGEALATAQYAPEWRSRFSLATDLSAAKLQTFEDHIRAWNEIADGLDAAVLVTPPAKGGLL